MKAYLIFLLMIPALAAGFVPAAAAADGATAKTTVAAEASSEVQGLSSEPKADSVAVSASEEKADVYEEEYTDEEDDFDAGATEEIAVISDPIEPFNRAMNTFNDKLYFWLLKPVAQGYKVAVPEPARISVKNFFRNLKYPVRFVSCLLQTDFAGAATETGRFAINTIWGMGGLMDPASGGELQIPMQDTDLGQTLGVYGVGHGFYMVWPFLGPSSPRDSVDIFGNQVLYPLSYLNVWYASPGAKAFETVNSTSLRIGDYESLVGAAIDPYIAIRDAYVQYRAKDIKARKARSLLFKDAQEERQK